VEEFYDGDYRRLLASPEGSGIEEWGNLNGALIENKRPGAGAWARKMAADNIAATRARLRAAPPPADSPALRTRAAAGDVEALYLLNLVLAERLTQGPLPAALQRNRNQLRDLVRQADYAPGLWLLGEEIEYRPGDKDRDMAAAVEFYRRAAVTGEVRALDRLAKAFHAPGEAGVAPNFLEVEQWLLEAAARAQPGDFTVMPPDAALYLLYGGTAPIGFTGSEMGTRPHELRWFREMIRRGGEMAELARVSLAAQAKRANVDVERVLAQLPPEVAPFAPAEVAELEKAAAAGHVPSLLKLADALATGRGLRQHDARAVGYYRQAAEKGSVEAMNRLAEHYASGYGVKKSPAERFAWTRRAAEAGDAKAWRAVGGFLRSGVAGQPPDGAAALAAYERAVAGGEVAALDDIGRMHRYGQGVPKDLDRAVAAYERAIATGLKNLETTVASLHEERKDAANALVWRRKAWEAGDRASGLKVAEALDKTDRAAATALYRQLAEAGDDRAQFTSAARLEEDGDFAGAVVWYRKVAANPQALMRDYSARRVKEHDEEAAAAPGSDLHFRKLARAGDPAAAMTYAERVFRKDKDEAMGWVRQAAEKKHPPALRVLALDLAQRDLAGGIKLLTEAADAGDAEAKLRLGSVHFQGNGVPRDPARGLALMLEAAELKFPPAQFDMGRAFISGVPGHLPVDVPRGLALLQQAAEANLPAACALLGEAYERGLPGFPADPKAALGWYQRARKLGLAQVAPAIQRLEQAAAHEAKK
jgi:TPR repeat protein